jgi:hypothetical protein
MNSRIQEILEARRAFERASTRREYDAAWTTLCALWKREREEFAARRGWRTCAQFTTVKLRGLPATTWIDSPGAEDAIDHGNYFAWNDAGSRQLRAAGIISHVYGHDSVCFAFARHYGLVAERLPYSWYWPNACTAILFTRGAK